MTSKTIAKVAAILAGAGLILSSFALALPAGAQTIQTSAVSITGTAFTRDLTIGSRGSDVVALQTFLISKGYSIPAGPTGYFGTQTQAAVASYQAANGITPAAGYFGPITRAKVNAFTPTPMPSPAPDEDDEDDENEGTDDDKSETRDAIDGARDALDDARDEVEEADDDGENIDGAEDLLDRAEERLDEADEHYDDEEYDDAMELVVNAQDLIDEAFDEIDDNNDDDDARVDTSAEVNERSGADNDSATFEIEITLDAFNQDAYIARDESVSINYEIQDAGGDEVSGATSVSAVLQSGADTEGNYFVFREGDEETLALTVSFDPLAADEQAYYRLQLESIEFNDSASAPDQVWTASPQSRFRTDYVYISD